MTDEMTKAGFDPAKHITKIKTKQGSADYLNVQWRLVWFRQEHPDGIIETELLSDDGTRAVFKATVTTRSGAATGHGDMRAGERDADTYLTKAETKSLGRALAALGFGTQFAFDFKDAHDGDEVSGAIADSPISLARTKHRPAPSTSAPATGQGDPDAPATEKQVNYAVRLAREVGIVGAAVDDLVRENFGAEAVDQLNRADMSKLIEWLLNEKRGAGDDE